MTSESLKEEIRSYCLDYLEIADVGFTSAETFFDIVGVYESRNNEGLACPLELRPSVEALIDPKLLLPMVSSIITIVEPHSSYVARSNITRLGENYPLIGQMATGTASKDYHLIIIEKLEKLGEMLKERYQIHSLAICDTSPLSDRALAVRAGLGVIRRNGMFYHPIMGSYVHIGSLLIDYPMDVIDHKKEGMPCGHCKICKIKCPGNAIIGDGTINSNKCVSYLTQKKEVTDSESEVMGQMIYGCDVCQQSCPENKKVLNQEIPLIIAPEVELAQLLAMDNKTFKESYGLTASGWRGKRTLQRNAIIALGQIKNQEALKILRLYEDDSRPIIKKEVERSIKKLKVLGVD